MAYESLVEKIKFRSGKFDKELFERIVKYLIEERELITSENIEVYRSGIEVRIQTVAEIDLVEKFNIDIVQAVDYLSIASFLISVVLLSKIEGEEPRGELEQYIVKKLYTPELKKKFLTRKFMTNPILEEFEILKFVKDTPEGPLESYGVRISVDNSGDMNFEEFFFETTKETLQKIIGEINSVIHNDTNEGNKKEE